jgi:hypothetical protein
MNIHANQCLSAECRWYRKREATFSDGLALVRRHLWRARYLVNSTPQAEFVQFPLEAFEHLLSGLPLAA